MYTNEWGTISSRKLELFNDDRSIYLRQVWGYGKTNKEIFIQDKDKKNSWQTILTMCIQSIWVKA